MQNNERRVSVGGSELITSNIRNINFINNNEIARSIVGKLIKDPKKTGVSGYDGKRHVDESVINTLSKQTASNIEDASYIFQSLPDTKTAMEIWTSCIISPKDGLTEALVWKVDNAVSDYSAELFSELLNIVKDYFENEYDIFSILKPAIEDALFKTGSYPLVIIPESSIDDLVSGKSAVSNESIINTLFKKGKDNDYRVTSKGFLGPVKKKVSSGLESLIHNATVNHNSTHSDIHPLLTVTDNPDLLKFKTILNINTKRNARENVRKQYGLEAYADVDLSKTDKVTPGSHVIKNDDKDENKEKEKENRFDTKIKENLVQKLYRDVAYSSQPIITVKAGKDATRMPVGHPLVLKVPSSSIIPVHVPGNPRDVLGAFIVVDEYGNPLDSSNANDLFDESRQKAETSITGAISIIKSMNFYKEGCCNTNGDASGNDTLNELAKTYGSLVEEDLLHRLWNGINGQNVKIAHVEEIYRIMLARALSAMKTQIVYVPGELLTYFAFDYNRYGIGKSLLEDGKTLAAMRATMMYAGIYSNIQNAIGRRKLTITLDEADVNPMRTIETTRSEFSRINAWNIPLINEGPIDVVNTLREHNIDTVIQGDNPIIPNTQIEVEDVTVSRATPDDDTSDKIRNLHISSFGLPPTIVDETQQQQFAVSVLQSHSLLNKRVRTNQRITSEDLLYDHITKYVLNSGTLIKRLALKIKENKDLLTDTQRQLGNAMPIIEDFLEVLSIELPAPDSMRADDIQSDLDKYKNLIDNVVDAVFPDDTVQLFLPESIKEQYNVQKEALKATLLNRYVQNNNFLPDLYDLLDMDNQEDTILSELKQTIEPYVKSASEIVLSADKIRKLYDSKALKAAAPSDDDYGSSSSYDDSSSDDSGDSDDEGGDDDFGDFGDFGDDGDSDESSDGDDTQEDEDDGGSEDDNNSDVADVF